MKIKQIIMSVLLCVGCLTASAQQQAATKEDYTPHWYVQGQIGGQYTLGEVSFDDLLSGNVQVAGGYNFTPVWGLRLSANAWQSKGGTNLTYMDLGVRTWKYNYIAPTLDVTCDLTNWIFGYKSDRVCNFGLLAGFGANIAWGNDDAQKLAARIQERPATDVAHQMTLLWDGTKARMTGRVGAYLDFKVSQRVALGLEFNANVLSDNYNSKKADNTDWYFNALAGVKYHFGKAPVKKVTTNAVAVAPTIVEKVVEKIVEKPVEKIVYKEPEAPAREKLRRDIFFNIRGSEVSKTEMPKVEDVVAYLNKYPEAKVNITGYADKGTGNAKLNDGYARKRAQMVADLLMKKFGIAASRISVDSKGDTVQPYEQNDLNRVSICIAE